MNPPDGSPQNQIGEKPIDPKRAAARSIRAVLLFVLVWCALGALIYPDWWYGLIFEGQFRSAEYWGSGNFYAVYNTVGFLFPPLLVVWAILSLSNSTVPARLQKINQRVAGLLVSTFWYWIILATLAIAFGIGLYFSGPRSQPMRDLHATLEKSKRDLEERLAKIKTSEVPPLSDPTSFAYIDSSEVESLYGQNEPELVPTLVKKKIEDSRKGEATAGLGDYFKTNAGLSEVRGEEEELKRTEKNPQRKLKDLIDFLYGQNKLKRYGIDQSRPEELKKVDEATALLNRYGVIADEKRLRSVRDRLFSEEVNRLEADLSSFHGLILVDGDWNVERIANGYRFRAPVIEHISSPLSFEFQLNDTDIQPKTKQVIENYKLRPIRLTAFGNVIAGASLTDQNVHIIPIAVY